MASAIETARIAIDDLILDGWVDSNGWPLTEISWPNDSINPTGDLAYIAIDYLWGSANVETKNGRNTVVGILSVDIYVPAEDGTGRLYELADDLRDILNRVESSGVRFAVPGGPRIIPNENGSHVRGNVSTNFTVEEVVT